MKQVLQLEADNSKFISGVKAANDALVRHQKGVHQTMQQYNNFKKSQDKVSASSRGSRGQLNQLGHQIQDVTVQLQMGTNAFTVFAQQGSQMASVFGSKGAIVGAMIAIGGAIAGSLLPNLFEARYSVKRMEEDITDLGKAMSKDDFNFSFLSNELLSLGSISDAALKTGLEANIIRAKNVAATAVTEIASDFREIGVSFGLSDLGDTITSLNKNLGFSVKETKGYSVLMDDLKTSFGLTGQEGYKTADSIVTLMASIQKDPGIEKFTRLQTILNDLAQSDSATDEVKLFVSNLTEMVTKGTQASAQMEFFTAKLAEFSSGTAESEAQLKRTAATYRELSKQVAVANIGAEKGKDAQDEYTFALQQGYSAFESMPKALQDLYKDYQKYNKQIQDNLESERLAAAAAAERTKQEEKRKSLLQKMRDEIAVHNKLQEDGAVAADRLSFALSNGYASFDAMPEAIRTARIELEKFNVESGKTAGYDPTVGLSAIQNSAKEKFDSMMNSFAMEEDALATNVANKLQIARDYFLTSGGDHEKYAAAMMAIEEELHENTKQTLMGQFNQLASMFDQTTALGKAFYVIQQGMAAADAIMKGYQTASSIRLAYAQLAAATANPALAATGEVQANASIAMGFATAGAIAGQTLASFEGGGITFSGVRSGGMDGKGGRMAVVHPNEKITDLEKGDSTGRAVNVSFTINAVDTKGFDQLLQSRRGQIVGMVQKAVNNVGRRIM